MNDPMTPLLKITSIETLYYDRIYALFAELESRVAPLYRSVSTA